MMYHKRTFLPKVLEKLFRLINKETDGSVTRQEVMDFIANLTYARYEC